MATVKKKTFYKFRFVFIFARSFILLSAVTSRIFHHNNSSVSFNNDIPGRLLIVALAVFEVRMQLLSRSLRYRLESFRINIRQREAEILFLVMRIVTVRPKHVEHMQSRRHIMMMTISSNIASLCFAWQFILWQLMKNLWLHEYFPYAKSSWNGWNVIKREN